jgi:hypothetical protein
MTQALYAHLNNKTIKKDKKRGSICYWSFCFTKHRVLKVHPCHGMSAVCMNHILLAHYLMDIGFFSFFWLWWICCHGPRCTGVSSRPCFPLLWISFEVELLAHAVILFLMFGGITAPFAIFHSHGRHWLSWGRCSSHQIKDCFEEGWSGRGKGHRMVVWMKSPKAKPLVPADGTKSFSASITGGPRWLDQSLPEMFNQVETVRVTAWGIPEKATGSLTAPRVFLENGRAKAYKGGKLYFHSWFQFSVTWPNCFWTFGEAEHHGRSTWQPGSKKREGGTRSQYPLTGHTCRDLTSFH